MVGWTTASSRRRSARSSTLGAAIGSTSRSTRRASYASVIRRRVIVHGFVQGVFFRTRCAGVRSSSASRGGLATTATERSRRSSRVGGRGADVPSSAARAREAHASSGWMSRTRHRRALRGSRSSDKIESCQSTRTCCAGRSNGRGGMTTRQPWHHRPEVSALGLGCMGMSDLYGPSEREGEHGHDPPRWTQASPCSTRATITAGHNELLIRDALTRTEPEAGRDQRLFGAMRDPKGSGVGTACPGRDQGTSWPTLRRLGTD